MEYGQIRLGNALSEPNELAIHRVREDGLPGCGDTLRPWRGLPATFVKNVDPTKCPDSIGMCGRNGCFPRR
jgi:hypothetical protein